MPLLPKPQITVYKTDQCRACPAFVASIVTALEEADLTADVDFVQQVPPYKDTQGISIDIVPTTVVSYKGKIVMSYPGVTSPSNIIDDIEQIFARYPSA